MEQEQQQDRKLLTVSDVAAYLSIKEKTVYAKVAAKEIPHYKLNYLIRFRLDEIDAWLGGCRQYKKPEAEQQKTRRKRKKASNRTNDHINKIAGKIIDEESNKYYSAEYGKSDRIEGPKKEINNGSI